MTMFELSPSVVTTTASASSMPASRSSWRSIPWPTRNSPVQLSPSRPRASWRTSMTATSQPAAFSSSATDEPTRPHPMMRTLMCWIQRSPASRHGKLLVEDALREGDDEDLAWGASQHVVDGRREEAGLPPPARRAAEHDQVGVRLVGMHHDRLPDRAGAQDRADDVDAELVPEQHRLRDRGGGPLLGIVHRRVERPVERHLDHVQRLDVCAV